MKVSTIVVKNGKKRLPSVSFVMPTYNREKTIYTGLRLLLDQLSFFEELGVEYEVLISENHSTDETRRQIDRVIKGYEKKIKIIVPPEHLPTAEQNLFFLIGNVANDYIWPIADDDYLVPGAIASIYNTILEKDLDFFLINGGLINQKGHVIEPNIFKMTQPFLKFNDFRELYVSIGSITLLASFSAVIFKAKPMQGVNFQQLVDLSKIYSHVFAYYIAFHGRPCGVISTSFSYLRKMTDEAHWKVVAARLGVPSYWFWTVGLARHFLNLIENHDFSPQDIARILNSDEHGRYFLLGNIKTMMISQVLESLSVRTERAIYSKEDWATLSEFFSTLPDPDPDYWKWIHFASNYNYDWSRRHGDSKMAGTGLMLDNLSSGAIEERTLKIYYDKLSSLRDSISGKSRLSSESPPDIIFCTKTSAVFSIGYRYFVADLIELTTLWTRINFPLLDIENDETLASRAKSFENYEDAVKSCIEQTSIKSEFLKNIQQLRKKNWNIQRNFTFSGNKIKLIGSASPDLLCAIANYTRFLAMPTVRSRKNDGRIFKPTAAYIFDAELYKENVARFNVDGVDLKSSDDLNFLHYLNFGNWCLLEPTRLIFDGSDSSLLVKYFGKSLTGDEDILTALFGFLEKNQRLSLNPYFDPVWYMGQVDTSVHRDVLLCSHPIFDFLQFGIYEGYSPHPQWDEDYYLEKNPDVKNAISDSMQRNFFGWVHWCKYGVNEGRSSSFPFAKKIIGE